MASSKPPYFQSLTIFFPAWNEQDTIERAVEAAFGAGDELIESGEIASYDVLIIDDASTDATPAIADDLAVRHDNVSVVHHPTNRKLGGSLKTGFANATGELVLYTDADLPFDMADVAKAVRLCRIYEADIVSVYRFDRTGEGPRRLVYSYVYNHLVQLAFGLRLRDMNFAFKLVRRRVFDHIELKSEGSFIDVELLARAQRLGYHIVQFGVDYFPRTRGISTLSSNAVIAKILREMRELRAELQVLQPLAASELRARRDVLNPMARLLIVNADDYGLTEGVSRAILRGHAEGIITSTSLLALAPGFEPTVSWLDDAPELGTGAHLAAVGEDPPLLSAREIPTLVDERGRLRMSWKQFLPQVALRRIDLEDVRREFAAQLERIMAIGRPIDHLDTHQNLHLWPEIGTVLLELGAHHGIDAIRVTRSREHGPVGLTVRRLAARLERRCERQGWAFPASSTGLDEAGSLALPAMLASLARLAGEGTASAELATHPGEAGDADLARYAWGYQWPDELEALCNPALASMVEELGFTLGTFGDLVGAGGEGRTA